MDDTLQELENELKRLAPRAPSDRLLRAIACDLVPAMPAAKRRRYVTATSLGSWKWGTWAMAGVAALLAFAFTVQSIRHPAPDVITSPRPQVTSGAPAGGQSGTAVPTANHYAPVHAASVLYDWNEGDATTLPDLTEGREVRYRYVDTYTWKNPATNASLRWSVPRDEVRLVRANLD